LDYGLRRAPQAGIADLGQFLARWSGESHAFAVMEKRMFQDLQRRGVPMRLVTENAVRVLVARH